MHPILARKERLALYLAAWIPIAALLAGVLVLYGHISWGKSAAVAAPMALICAFLCLDAWYLCRIFPIGKTSLPRIFMIFSAAAILSSFLWILIGKGWVSLISAIFEAGPLDTGYSAHIPLLFVIGVLLFLLSVTVHYLMSVFELSREAERRSLEARILAREAELKALKAQIDPHFLFNSLNSISALTAIDPAKSRMMCQLLAEFLRKSLDIGSRELITLEDELSLVSGYLAIERVRLGPRLSVRTEINESSGACLVPPLLLQPLVENAVRHGIAQLVDGGEICIAAKRLGSRLQVRVGNPCDPDRQEMGTNGIGLSNVRGRLKTLFGSEAGLDLERSQDRFEALLTLPAVGEQNEEGTH